MACRGDHYPDNVEECDPGLSSSDLRLPKIRESSFKGMEYWKTMHRSGLSICGETSLVQREVVKMQAGKQISAQETCKPKER